MTTRNLEHAENHMLLLGRKSSVEKVAAFLLEMDCRTGAEKMLLAMSRRDIADYLGLTIETVSRALSHLRRTGVVTFHGEFLREIILRDRRRLAGFDPQT
jgi:CRP/FNR family transcriptional regulator, nitrogen fixation regulation protein